MMPDHLHQHFRWRLTAVMLMVRTSMTTSCGMDCNDDDDALAPASTVMTVSSGDNAVDSAANVSKPDTLAAQWPMVRVTATVMITSA